MVYIAYKLYCLIQIKGENYVKQGDNDDCSSITLTGCEDPESKAKAELKAKTLQQVHEAGELGRNKEKLHNLMGDLAPKPKDGDTAEEK